MHTMLSVLEKVWGVIPSLVFCTFTQGCKPLLFSVLWGGVTCLT